MFQIFEHCELLESNICIARILFDSFDTRHRISHFREKILFFEKFYLEFIEFNKQKKKIYTNPYLKKIMQFSFSFFRVLPDLSIADLRSDILSQLEPEKLPNKFVFVRGVGRHYTEVSRPTF